MLSDRLLILRSIKEKEEGIKIAKTTISKKLDKTASTYGKWENGERTPDLIDIKNLANYFNVSIDYLLENDATESKKYAKETLAVIDAMNSAPLADRVKMLNTLKAAFPEYFK
ncbi:MAG: helix-turn-helix transcriptional regulator [Erysipelotrichaceae bacterium]